MESCVEGTDDVVVEDSVDSDGTASPFRTSRLGHIVGRDKIANQTSTGLRKRAKDTESSEEQMFSSSDEEDSEQSQLLLPQSPQISPHLSHLKPPDEPVFPPHLPQLKPPDEDSPVFPPPAKLRKLSGETRTKHSVENVDNDSDLTQLSGNIEAQPELDLGHTTYDLARKEPDGRKEMEGCYGDQNSKCSLEAQQPKLEGDKVTAAVQDSAVRGTTAMEETRLTQQVKTHPDGDLKKEGINKEGGTEKSESCVQKGKEVMGTQDVSEGSSEVYRERSSEEGSSSLGSLQESVVAVSDVGADKTMCQQHDEEMQLLGRLETRQEKLNPLLSTTDRATALKVRRELSCIQTLIATLIQAHQRQRSAINSLSTEQMQEQMQLFVQRHKRLVQIFSVQKTATAKFKGRMKVTATQSTKTLDGSSQLKAVLKAGSLQKGQIVEVVSKDGKQSVQYRVVGMESVGGESQPQTSEYRLHHRERPVLVGLEDKSRDGPLLVGQEYRLHHRERPVLVGLEDKSRDCPLLVGLEYRLHHRDGQLLLGQEDNSRDHPTLVW
ncbi:Hypp6407 [Branchiostoma lanceolatum]|uniref:Hypp6407 protein n=1 Tax=Branchiostoma lanceolatum TaxID=7740 RepID=A0A8K0E412_BRALA|nr:Hypp6407 [Branchiostoma lanceolatum]